MKYCHELFFDQIDSIARWHLQNLIANHAHSCAGNADDDWDWAWDDDRVTIRYRREDDMLLSARTLEQQHELYSDLFGVSNPLYRADAVYAD